MKHDRHWLLPALVALLAFVACLAMWVGATIETVIRAMSRWQKDGVLETHPWGFVLRDVALLSSLLENDCQPRSWRAA